VATIVEGGRAASAARPRSRAQVPGLALRVDTDFEEEFPGADASSSECYINICRTGDRLLGELNRRTRATFDLSASATTVLAIIDGSPEPITPSIIAERAIITSASATSVLDTLERRGLVVRRPHPDDRRKLVIELTGKGRQVVDKVLPGVHRLETRVMSVLSPAERTQFLRLLAKIQSGLALVAAEEAEPLEGVRNVPRRLRRS